MCARIQSYLWRKVFLICFGIISRSNWETKIHAVVILPYTDTHYGDRRSKIWMTHASEVFDEPAGVTRETAIIYLCLVTHLLIARHRHERLQGCESARGHGIPDQRNNINTLWCACRSLHCTTQVWKTLKLLNCSMSWQTVLGSGWGKRGCMSLFRTRSGEFNKLYSAKIHQSGTEIWILSVWFVNVHAVKDLMRLYVWTLRLLISWSWDKEVVWKSWVIVFCVLCTSELRNWLSFEVPSNKLLIHPP